MSTVGNIGRVILRGPAAWIFVAALLVLQFWPSLPESRSQWLLIIAFGPPFYVLGEAFFTWLFSPAHGHAVSSSRSAIARIVIALPVILAWLAFCWWLTWLFNQS